MSIILCCLYLYGVSGFITFVFNKRFEKSLPLAILFIILNLYVFGFFGNIRLGFYFCVVYILALIVLILINLKNKEKIKEFIKNYFTIGFVLFLIIIIATAYITKNRHLTYWDEFMHWGPMVKEMFRLDKFYCVDLSQLKVHKDYPPFFSLLELLFCYFGNRFNESYLYRSLIVFLASLFMPLLSKYSIKKKSDWIKSLFICGSIVLLFLTCSITPYRTDNPRLLNSIYIDFPLAIYGAYCFYLGYKLDNEDKFEIINLSLSLACLILMKQISIAFYCLVLLLLFVMIILKKTKINKILIMIAAFIGVPLLFRGAWAIYSSQFEIYKQFVVTDAFNISLLTKIINGTGGEPWQIETYNNFLEAIKIRPMVTHPFNMTFFVYALFLTVVLAICLKGIKNKISISLIYLFGSVAFVVMMFLLYLFSFGEVEGPALASFDRYISSYLIYGNVLCYMVIINDISEKRDTLKVIMAFILIIPFVEYEDLPLITPTKTYTGIDGGVEHFEFIYDDLDNLNEDSNVLVVSQFYSDYMGWYLQYKDIGKESRNKINALFDEDYYEYIIKGSTDVFAKEEFKENIKKFDYIYVWWPTDVFIENYWKQITDKDIIDKGLFKINIDGSNINLELVNDPFNR